MRVSSSGWVNGMIGVVLFSGSMPATRAAIMGFTPLFLTAARALIAAALGGLLLLALRQKRPARTDLPSLAIVAGGAVIGFPLLTAFALQHITAGRSLVFLGLLPLSTAIFGVLRGGERPHPAFWAFALAGASAVAGFALNRGANGSALGDALMVVAVVLCGLAYAEGAVLSRRLGGWQAISWSLVVCSPVAALLAALTWPATFSGLPVMAWGGLVYVSVFTMLLGFIFWYRGLALGGIAKVGQLQLLQPFMGLGLSAFFLRETVAPSMIAATAAVVLCVGGARRFA
ncbi:DMT family transporter [Novosphingobium terrae]|uniref:DMT family transporter n=1 Tax=Novosphingobium terrae TaxID=2726189 RepID=UPI00197E99B9|nr:DMT family transporter [Novosphingobium terrae]